MYPWWHIANFSDAVIFQSLLQIVFIWFVSYRWRDNFIMKWQIRLSRKPRMYTHRATVYEGEAEMTRYRAASFVVLAIVLTYTSRIYYEYGILVVVIASAWNAWLWWNLHKDSNAYFWTLQRIINVKTPGSS